MHNAFNILVNEGFLRNQQGVQTIEVVQKFYQVINEPMRKATMVKKDLNSLCPDGKFTLNYQAVIILVFEDSQANETLYHAVRMFIIMLESLSFRLQIFILHDINC